MLGKKVHHQYMDLHFKTMETTKWHHQQQGKSKNHDSSSRQITLTRDPMLQF
jgi:hypothetical protein